MNLQNTEQGDTLLVNGDEYHVTDVSVEDIGIAQVIVVACAHEDGTRLIETTDKNDSVKIVDTENETYWKGQKREINAK